MHVRASFQHWTRFEQFKYFSIKTTGIEVNKEVDPHSIKAWYREKRNYKFVNNSAHKHFKGKRCSRKIKGHRSLTSLLL